MNNTDPTVPADAVLDDLRNTPGTPDAPGPDPSADDPAADRFLGLLPPAADGTAAAAAVDALTTEPPLPSPASRRARLLETVDRELAARRRDTGPVQAVLRRRRQETGTTLEDVAAQIGQRTGQPAPDPEDLSRIETGKTDLRHNIEAVRTVADWAVAAGLGRDAAVHAISTSLRTSSPEPFLAAAGTAGDAPLSDVDQSVVREFETQYDTTAATEGTR